MGKIFHYYILCTWRLNLSLIFIVFLSGYQECLLAKLRETSTTVISELATKGLLKMPGPYRTITISSDFERSDECDRKFNKISESFAAQELALTNDRTLFHEGKKSPPESSFNTTNDTRAHQVHPTDPKKMALISTSLPPA